MLTNIMNRRITVIAVLMYIKLRCLSKSSNVTQYLKSGILIDVNYNNINRTYNKVIHFTLQNNNEMQK